MTLHVQFYDAGPPGLYAGPGFRNWLNRTTVRILGAIHPPYTHVNVRWRRWVFESGVYNGFFIRPAGVVREPAATIEVECPHLDPMRPEEIVRWELTDMTVVRGLLHVLGFPRIWPVRTCVTEVAGLLRVRRACRTPLDLYEALMDGDFDGRRVVCGTRGRDARGGGIGGRISGPL